MDQPTDAHLLRWGNIRHRMTSAGIVRLLGATGASIAVVVAPSDDALLPSAVAIALIAVSTIVTTFTSVTPILDRWPLVRVIALHVGADLANMLITVAVIDPASSHGSWALVLVPVGEAALLSLNRRLPIAAAVISIVGLGSLMVAVDGLDAQVAGRWALIVFLAGGPMSVFLVQSMRVQTALHSANAARRRMHVMATHDELTGLLNRRGLTETTDDHGTPSAVLFIDLDRFKEINDTFGHDAGDEVLRVVGNRLQELIADAGDVARLGGDEFAVALHDRGADRLDLMVADVERVLTEPLVVCGDEVAVGASVGIARSDSDGDDLLRLLDRADGRMYARKRRRRTDRDGSDALDVAVLRTPDPAPAG